MNVGQLPTVEQLLLSILSREFDSPRRQTCSRITGPLFGTEFLSLEQRWQECRQVDTHSGGPLF